MKRDPAAITSLSESLPLPPAARRAFFRKSYLNENPVRNGRVRPLYRAFFAFPGFSSLFLNNSNLLLSLYLRLSLRHIIPRVFCYGAVMCGGARHGIVE